MTSKGRTVFMLALDPGSVNMGFCISRCVAGTFDNTYGTASDDLLPGLSHVRSLCSSGQLAIIDMGVINMKEYSDRPDSDSFSTEISLYEFLVKSLTHELVASSDEVHIIVEQQKTNKGRGMNTLPTVFRTTIVAVVQQLRKQANHIVAWKLFEVCATAKLKYLARVETRYCSTDLISGSSKAMQRCSKYFPNPEIYDSVKRKFTFHSLKPTSAYRRRKSISVGYTVMAAIWLLNCIPSTCVREILGDEALNMMLNKDTPFQIVLPVAMKHCGKSKVDDMADAFLYVLDHMNGSILRGSYRTL